MILSTGLLNIMVGPPKLIVFHCFEITKYILLFLGITLQRFTFGGFHPFDYLFRCGVRIKDMIHFSLLPKL